MVNSRFLGVFWFVFLGFFFSTTPGQSVSVCGCVRTGLGLCLCWGFALCFLLSSALFTLPFLFLSSFLPAEKTKDILSLDSSPPLLAVPDPFIPLPLSDTPGNQNRVGGGRQSLGLCFVLLIFWFSL